MAAGGQEMLKEGGGDWLCLAVQSPDLRRYRGLLSCPELVLCFMKNQLENGKMFLTD